MLCCWRWLSIVWSCHHCSLLPSRTLKMIYTSWNFSPCFYFETNPFLIHPPSFSQSFVPSFCSVKTSYLPSLLLPSLLSLPGPPFTSLPLSRSMAISTLLPLPSTLVMFTIFSSFLPLPSFANFSPSRQTRYRPYVERMTPEMSEQDYVSQTEWSW